MIWVGSVTIVVGAATSLLAAIGVLRFADPIARMHAATKSASLGLSLLTLGAGLVSEAPGMFGIGLLVTVLLFVTAPISAHMVGRAAYRTNPPSDLAHDDLARDQPAPTTLPRSTERRFSLARWGAVVIVWLLLWRDVSAANVVGGAVVGVVLEALRSTTARIRPVNPWAAARLLGFYVVQLFKSNARVAWEVITPDDTTIREAIVACPLASRSEQVALLVANAVSFAPGTLTLEMTPGNPHVLYVHVLHYESHATVRQEVAELERRVREAFGEERAGLDAG